MIEWGKSHIEEQLGFSALPFLIFCPFEFHQGIWCSERRRDAGSLVSIWVSHVRLRQLKRGCHLSGLALVIYWVAFFQ